MRRLDIKPGEKFGLWTIVDSPMLINYLKRTSFLCECSCSDKTRRYVSSNSLVRGISTNCGCVRKVSILKSNTKHGFSYNRLYGILYGMKSRCLKTSTISYKNYGGRGIKICDEWLDEKTGLKTFIEWAMRSGYQSNLSIDRINNDGNYEPSNCRWSTSSEQNNNTRSNVHITINGVTKTMGMWAKQYGINKGTFSGRLRKGFPSTMLLKPPGYFKDRYLIKINLPSDVIIHEHD